MDISDEPAPSKSDPPPSSASSTLAYSSSEPRRTQSAPVLPKPLKGRVFELLADEDDNGSSGTSSPHDWDGEINEPPPPQPNVTPQDTVPPVPSPLCMCISGETAGTATKPQSEHVSIPSSPRTTVQEACTKSPLGAFGHAHRRMRRSLRSKKPLKSALSSSDEERSPIPSLWPLSTRPVGMRRPWILSHCPLNCVPCRNRACRPILLHLRSQPMQRHPGLDVAQDTQTPRLVARAAYPA